MVGRGGFEPPKAEPTDLQSVPFGHSGISPAFEAITPPKLNHLKQEIPLKNKPVKLAPGTIKWSWQRDLNPRPADYKSAALPTELRQLLISKKRLYYFFI